MFIPPRPWKAANCVERLIHSYSSPSPHLLTPYIHQARTSNPRFSYKQPNFDPVSRWGCRPYSTRLPSNDSAFQDVKHARQIVHGQVRGRGTRGLFAGIPHLLKKIDIGTHGRRFRGRGVREPSAGIRLLPRRLDSHDCTHGRRFKRALSLRAQSKSRAKAPSKICRCPPRSRDAVNPSTPAEALISALGLDGTPYATPTIYHNRLDLSHHDPMSFNRFGRPSVKKRCNGASGIRPLSGSPGKDLKYLLAGYIQRSRGEDGQVRLVVSGSREQVMPDEQVLQIFNDEDTVLLEKYGFDLTDVDIWTWILIAKSSGIAALRLWTVANAPDVTKPRAIPAFIFLFLLRRQDWNPRSLRVMIQYAWSRLGGSRATVGPSANPDLAARSQPWRRKRRIVPYLRDSTPVPIGQSMLIFVRLLRHARKVYPEACGSIATLLAHHLNLRSQEVGSKLLDSPAAARLAFLFNSALSLLALPASIRPFLSIAYQQRAQFKLLRSMNEFEPALTVDRKGYRAVTKVQLAHKKTIQERDWAAMKAKSWPPWKEDRSGLDTEKGPECGISRAGESTRRQMEAGYADQDWEESAGILAGWDTDESPTIQTRTLMAKPIMSRRAHRSHDIPLCPSWKNVWAARIRATRTVDEAWACFLAYRDEKRRPVQDVYYALFEKVVFEEKRLKHEQESNTARDSETPDDDSDIPLPGDSRMVYEKPGPNEAIYVRTSSPGTTRLFDMTLLAGIRPSGRFLAFILSHAKHFKVGLWYLRESAVPRRVTYALLTPDTLDDSQTLDDIGYMSDYTFAAFIRFLCRFSPAQSHRYLPVVYVDAKFLPPGRLPLTTRRINPLLQAIRLVLARRPFYRPPWNSLLSALARSAVSVHSENAANGFVDDLLAWRYMQTVLRQMGTFGLELDFAGFHTVCVGLEKAIFAAARASALPEAEVPNETALDARQVLEDGVPFVKTLFKRLVLDGVYGAPGANSADVQRNDALAMADILPRLLEVPHPAHLHSFIRVLGLREDYHGIQALVEWMSHFALEIQVVTDESANGRTLLRRSLVAVRVFLEQTWTSDSHMDQQTEDVEEDRGSQADGALEVGEVAAESPCLIAEDPESDVLSRVYEVVQNSEGWGGWPTDEEVETYCRKKTRNEY